MPSVLIVDDEPGVRSALGGVLRDEGYEVDAVEAMEQRGTIEIETRHAPAEKLVRIMVADDGPGIPVADRDKLFLPYFSTKKRGTGLGLAVARRFVEDHGGRLELVDGAGHETRGARFRLSLPLDAADERPR